MVADAIVAGLREIWGEAAELIALPLADGGEGTIDVFLAAGATTRHVRVSGPYGGAVEAVYARRGATAVIEMASASGLHLTRPDDRLRNATTFGTGELIRAALDDGAEHVMLAIGGSATNDGGAGALLALGVRFYAADGRAVEPSPEGLRALSTIDVRGLDPRLAQIRFEIACDVTNPLLGATGATAVYAPQKGARPDELAELEAALERFAARAVATSGRDLRAFPGSGAAGGLGFGLATFARARLVPGFALVAESCGLAAALSGASWCLTGEGRIDAQTLAGKVVDGVATMARVAGVRVGAFGGSVDPTVEPALAERGVVCLPIVVAPVELATAMRDAPALIRAAATRFARLVRPV